MNIETKFNIGDEVMTIENGTRHEIFAVEEIVVSYGYASADGSTNYWDGDQLALIKKNPEMCNHIVSRTDVRLLMEQHKSVTTRNNFCPECGKDLR